MPLPPPDPATERHRRAAAGVRRARRGFHLARPIHRPSATTLMRWPEGPATANGGVWGLHLDH
jgi:hypothetical protein